MEKITIKIDSLAYKGSGVGRVDNIVYFIPWAAPEDFLEVEIVKKEKRFCIGRILKIIEPSPYRVEPVCRYFGECGGCNWQHITYERQLKEKRKILKDAITRIGTRTSALVDIDPVIPSPDVYGYRNRTCLKSFSNGRRIGYFAAKSHKLIEIDSCPVLLSKINSFLPGLKAELTSQSPKSPKLTQSQSLSEIDVYVDPEGSLHHSYNFYLKKADIPFSQVNYKVNSLLKDKIYSLITDYTQKKPPGILDLFCGDGNLSIHLSGIADFITGWDLSYNSIRKGNKTVSKMGLQNVVYKHAHITKALTEIEKLKRSTTILIVDPPRKGLKGITSAIARMEIPFIFYISCVPPALARDLKDFVKAGYMIKKIFPFDMFPQTYHIETLVVLSR